MVSCTILCTAVTTLCAIFELTSGYYVPACDENGICMEQEADDQPIVAGMMTSVFGILDATFGWIFNGIDALFEYFMVESDESQGLLESIFDYMGLIDQISPRPKISALQRFVCAHHKKVISMIIVLIGSLLYVWRHNDKSYRIPTNDDLDFVEHYNYRSSDMDNNVDYLDVADQTEEIL